MNQENLKKGKIYFIAMSGVVLANCFSSVAIANDDELAKQVQNPIADLISLPIKVDIDNGIGSDDASRSVYVVQPVIPFSISDDWNVISRTITPVYIDAESPVAGGSSTTGNGDILQSFFFSPKKPTSSGWVWGVGPAASIPTASEKALGSEKWSIGPTGVALKQHDGWTYGALANHLISVAGDDDRDNISATFVQPFLSYTTSTFTSFGINTETSYDWKSEQWTVPVNLSVSQIVRVAGQPISLQAGYRHYFETPNGGPDHGFRLQLTLLFPK